MKFFFDGKRIGPDDTPATHDMEDSDKIDAMMAQQGG